MTVPAASLHADLAAVDDEVSAGRAENVEAAVAERGRGQRGPVGLECVEPVERVRSEEPEGFFEAAAGGRRKIAALKDHRGVREQVPVVVQCL